MDLGQPKRMDNGMARCTGIEEEASKFSRAVGGDRPSSVSVTRFVIDNSKVFAVDTNVNHQDRLFLSQGGGVPSRLDFGSSIGMGKEHHVIRQCKERNGEGSKRTHNGDCSAGGDEIEDQADDDEEDDDDEGDGEVEGLASVDNTGMKNHNNSSGSVQSTSGKIYRDRAHSQDHNFLLGLRGGDVIDNVDNGRGGMGKQKYQQYQTGPYDCAIATSDSEIHHARISPGQHTSILPRVEAGVENGFRPCESKVVTSSSDFAESLRMHLSDPITGSLMDDAVILFCGHSYGSSGMQHVTRMRACMRCGYPVSGDSIRPNFSLRAAVQAFLREDQSYLSKSSKRRRDGLAQGIFNCYDSFHTDGIRGKGVQFPFEVSDRVIIKGNKRTPTRFVGRIAVVTTQCLNGWYVVKTLDNAESVKLQYRSLAKVSDGMMSNKTPLQIGY